VTGFVVSIFISCLKRVKEKCGSCYIMWMSLAKFGVPVVWFCDPGWLILSYPFCSISGYVCKLSSFWTFLPKHLVLKDLEMKTWAHRYFPLIYPCLFILACFFFSFFLLFSQIVISLKNKSNHLARSRHHYIADYFHFFLLIIFYLFSFSRKAWHFIGVHNENRKIS
jgi:hypothetical protein